MNTRQLIAAAAFATTIFAPSIGMANSVNHSGDATTHVVQGQSKGATLSQQTVLNELITAQRKGELSVGDSTPTPAASVQSNVTRMSVISMIKSANQNKGDAS